MVLISISLGLKLVLKLVLKPVFSILSGPSSLDLSGSTDPTNKDGGKHLTVSVVLGGSTDHRINRLILSHICSWINSTFQIALFFLL